MKKLKTLSGAFVLLIVLICFSSVYIVKEGQLVILTSFGKAIESSHENGFYVKAPWPFQDLIIINAKSHLFQGQEEQVLTSDQNSLIVQSHVLWRVKPDMALLFWEKIKTQDQFERRLQDLLRSEQMGLLGSLDFSKLFPVKGQSSGRLKSLEESLLKNLSLECLKTYGVEILSVGFNRIGLTENVLENVHNKMNSERKIISDRLKAEGESEAKKIRVAAQAEYDQSLAQVEGQVKEILGKAEAESIDAYRALAKDPDLAIKLKKIESLQSLLEGRSTLVLDPSVSPLDILKTTSN